MTNDARPDTTPAPAGGSLLDKYTDPVVPKPPAATVKAEDFSRGTLCRFLESEKVQPGQNSTNKRPWWRHVFMSHDDRRFAINGTAQLDARLKVVRPNENLYVRYLGADAENVHQWDVRRLAASHAQLAALRDEIKPALEWFAGSLDTAWDEHNAREAEFRAQVRARRDQAAPPHTDADMPPGYN